MTSSDGITPQQNILVISLEFVQPLFSGNGILAQSLVRGLLRLNYNVTVLCARPENPNSDDGNDADWKTVTIEPQTNDSDTSSAMDRMDDNPNLNVLVVDVPSHTWRKLDRYSCFEYLAQGAVKAFSNYNKSNSASSFATASANTIPSSTDNEYSFDHVFAIDWSSIPTVEILKEHHILSTSTTFVFLVFRVFSSSKELCSSHDDYTFYVTRELDAIQKADVTFVLSHVDQSSLQQIQMEQQQQRNSNNSSCSTTSISSLKELYVHVPPLRNDFYIRCQNIPSLSLSSSPLSQASSSNQGKRYVMCNVRLSPEKNALLFAQLMSGLSKQNILQSLNLTPIIIGSVCDETYAKQVYDALPSSTIIINTFLNSEELISILNQTILMIHPPLYDAFGMTIAEGAAVGVPSLVHNENIGASSLFCAEKEEILQEDLNAPTGILVENVKEYLESSDTILRRIARNAQSRALSWTVKEYAEGFKVVLDSLCTN